MGKRGELSVNKIVVIVILIISFIIILLFWLQLRPRGETDKEICRNSVQTRGLVPIFKDISRLNCKTQKICITADKCSEDYDESIKVESKEDVQKEITNLIYDCWWMMGEGKVNYHGAGAFKNIYCAQCFLVDFDKSVKEDLKINEVKYLDLYEYMRKTKIPNKDENFMNYLYGTDDIGALRNALTTEGIDIDNSFIATSGRYAVVTGIIEEGKLKSWGTAIGTVAGSVLGGGIVLFTGPPGWAVGAIIIGVGSFGGTLGMIAQPGNNEFLSPMLVPYDAEVLGAMECKGFDTLI